MPIHTMYDDLLTAMTLFLGLNGHRQVFTLLPVNLTTFRTLIYQITKARRLIIIGLGKHLVGEIIILIKFKQ
jgi:hypothetical protein